MTIVIVSNSFSAHEGGAAAIAFDQARALAALGHDVLIFAGSPNFAGWSQENGLPVYRVKIKDTRWFLRSYFCLRNFRLEREFKKFLKKVQPDIIHFHNLYYQFPFSLLKIARQFTPKVFFTAHDVMAFSQTKLDHFVDKKYNLENISAANYRFSWWKGLKRDRKAFNPWRNFIIRHYLKYATKIFSVSAELKKALTQNKIKNIEVIHNGINAAAWQVSQPEVDKLKKELDLTDKKIVLLAGRLSGYKGVKQIMAAFDEVVQVVPNALLLVLDSKNKYKNHNPYVYLAGSVPRDKMKYYYAVSDLAVVPSICFDSFPTINLEAMAGKKPVIATIFGGSKEVVENNKTGFLVNPLAVDGLAKKIIYLLQNSETALSMGESGYQKIKSDFNQEKWLGKILRWYSK
ncbi:hypothetical protein A3H03_03500 [Candidatus Kuenenbacteria bacterium RIFCSPLOWO2_12_FULL_42_13]|uniref:Glycosyltransferase subfamily 4-like N-terminal domain-containing protein n=1 Tax=Candidatus Kuenenbacteria bacterium RIFCSPLOWO2_12_FULL_42_13 TaxID=1798565 RepID=A0A1F6FZV9_9BACT|nr:MAG: hypothetical protein A3H03_03500 [Candidatus Kuenenbacteria bacterium RIFCSPLOWO2_12_FULL_42_13]